MLLGMEVSRGPDFGDITLTQRVYIDQLAEAHGLLEANSVSTPIAPGMEENLSEENGQRLGEEEITHYQSLVGSINYAVITHPEIAYSVSRLTRDMCAPTSHHLGLAKRVIRYLRGARDIGICFRKGDKSRGQGGNPYRIR